MISIVTRRNLLAEKTRFFISVGGIALSVFLISFLLALFQGWNLQVGRFVERVDADIWVMSEGTTSFLTAASILPEKMEEELDRVPNVRSVNALIVRPMTIDVAGHEEGTHLVGYNIETGVGGPLSIKRGSSAPGVDEVIVDNALTQRIDVGRGDTMRAAGRDLEVVAVSSGGDFVFSQTSFVSIETARALLGMEGLSTFYLLQLADDAEVEAVIGDVERDFPGTAAFSSEEFADSTRAAIMDNITPILIIILALAFVVGVAITGLTIYNAIVEKQREFGILKAIGFTNWYLFRLVFEQSFVTGLLGFAVGASATAIATRFVSDYVPQFVTVLRWQDILVVLGTTLIMSLIAGVLPVRRIAGVDPVAVFSA